MPVSALDPTPALVLIDLQKGIVATPSAHPVENIVTNAALLAAAFRRRRLPVVLVNVTGGAPGRTDIPRPAGTPPADWADLVEDLDVHEGDLRVTKRRWNAFYDTALDEELRAQGVTQLVLAGIATSMGVESTARSAHEHGYNVVLVTDAMTDRSVDAHTNSIERVFPKLGERASTTEVIALLEQTEPAHSSWRAPA